MDTTFKIILEGVVADAADKFLGTEGEVKEERQKRLVELLELNYPDFKDRYERIGRSGNVIYVEVKRDTRKKEPENIFV